MLRAPNSKGNLKNGNKRINQFKKKLIDGVDGELHVTYQNPSSSFKERIRVGVAIGYTSVPSLTKQEWEQLLRKKEAVSKSITRFTYGSKQWLQKGGKWLVPTMTFGTTKIEIKLKKGEILEYGIKMEIYTRNGSIVSIIPGGAHLKQGGTFCSLITWQIEAEGILVKPIFTTNSPSEITFRPVIGRQLV